MADTKYTPSKEAEEILDGYRLMDDNFMTLFFDQNYEATELLLNVILNRTDLKVKSLEVQKTEKNASVDGRNVILDIFAVDADGITNSRWAWVFRYTKSNSSGASKKIGIYIDLFTGEVIGGEYWL